MSELLSLSTEDLAINLSELKMKLQEPYLTEERKKQISREMAHITFELSERSKENGTTRED